MLVQAGAGLDIASTPSYGSTAAAHRGAAAAAPAPEGFGGAAAMTESSKCPLSRIPIIKDVMGGLLYLDPPAKFRNRPPPFKGLKLECPQAIVKMRAAFAATPPIQALRPQELHVRIAAVAATSLFTNVPLGAWREHLVKYSPAWFVAVHASIPLVIMMRKSVMLPKSAIIATIGCAILGQLCGSRLERARVEGNLSGKLGEGEAEGRAPLPFARLQPPQGLRPARRGSAVASCGGMVQHSATPLHRGAEVECVT